jgi:hypothetical protein
LIFDQRRDGALLLHHHVRGDAGRKFFQCALCRISLLTRPAQTLRGRTLTLFMQPSPRATTRRIINAEALAYMRQRALAGPVIARLAEHPDRFFANRAAWTHSNSGRKEKPASRCGGLRNAMGHLIVLSNQ